jgi:hypothetical protein
MNGAGWVEGDYGEFKNALLTASSWSSIIKNANGPAHP